MMDLKAYAAERKAEMDKAWGDPLGNAMKNKDECVPEDGFNLVALDGFADPGEQLEVVEHVATEAQAREAVSRFQKENPNSQSKLFVYGPNDTGWKV